MRVRHVQRTTRSQADHESGGGGGKWTYPCHVSCGDRSTSGLKGKEKDVPVKTAFKLVGALRAARGKSERGRERELV